MTTWTIGEAAEKCGLFSLLTSPERAVVLAARTRAVQTQLAHYQAMGNLATGRDNP